MLQNSVHIYTKISKDKREIVTQIREHKITSFLISTQISIIRYYYTHNNTGDPLGGTPNKTG